DCHTFCITINPASQHSREERHRGVSEKTRQQIGQLIMKLAGYLLALCSVLHGGLGLMVTLSEPGATDFEIFLSDSPRSIPLVPGKTYKISCEGMEWRREGEVVTVTSVGDGVSGVYVVSSGNMRILMLQLFTEDLVGEYVCMDESGEEFVVNISTGNPVLIPSREVIGLKRDISRTSLPFFSVFGSGDPQPQPTDYSWYFNGDPIFVNGVQDSSVVDVAALTFNMITLKQKIDSGVEGTYVSVVNTSAGETNVSITLNVEASPVPQISVIAPTDYSTNFSANGEAVIVNCSDVMADPLPAFSWYVNGSLVSGNEDYIAITSGNEGRESHLTITVSPEFNGVDVVCRSTNVVEDEPDSGEATETLKVLAPPPPPTNLTVVQTLSSCRVELSWIPPVDTDSALPPTFYRIEARAGGEGGEWEVVVGKIKSTYSTSEVGVMEALGETNVSYVFRISSGNERGGVSPVSTETDTNRPVQLYFEALPAVSAISVSSLSSSPPTALVVSWTNTPTECYLFSSHISVCTPTNGGETISSKTVPGTSSSADVTGLLSDSAYSCLVRSIVSDLVGREFPSMTSSSLVDGFTYPDYPEAPSEPQAVEPVGGIFPSTNITVRFPLPSDHSTINHYLVLVVRLRSEKDLPTNHPDTDYPAGYMFLNETTVNDASIERPLQGPYIAAEIAGRDFSGEFVIGGGRQPKYSPQYKNGPLLSGTKYSCFLRAFPRSSVAGRSRRQAEEGGRQDLIFNSSDYMPVQETGPEDSSESSSSTLSPAVTGVITAGVIVSLILIAALVLILVLVYCIRRRRGHKYRLEAHSASLSSSSKGSMDIPHDSTPELCRRGIPMELKPMDLTEEDSELIPSEAIPINVFREHVDKFDENRQLLFQREFDWIQMNAPDPSAEASSLPINDDKNRYSNIKAFDHSRVVLTPLEGEEGSDYINANFIPGYKKTKEYISTQGPLEQTVGDFWKMVWEQNTATIVMLTNLVEAGKASTIYTPHLAAPASLTLSETI
ncbi:Receptor-type tyrosine-protein phosphatase gamma, partial [Geodia barretti]